MSGEAVYEALHDWVQEILDRFKGRHLPLTSRDSMLLDYLERCFRTFFQPYGSVRDCEDLKQRLLKAKQENPTLLRKLLERFIQRFIEDFQFFREAYQAARETLLKPTPRLRRPEKKRKKKKELIAYV